MNILEIRDFSFSYPDQEKRALTEISLDIKEGTLNVICGRSGCGKSTLLRQMKSVLAPHGEKKGMILYKGKPLAELEYRTQSKEIGIKCGMNLRLDSRVWGMTMPQFGYV